MPYRLLNAASVHGDSTADNWLIQGDNLEALKALLPFYAGRVKCIYIDPPYNTKSAFEHYDDNLEHSQWLSMMYPRLELLRELLAEDGSIWVSIDDNEAHYLKVVMDEVFGRGNFVANVFWQKTPTRENRTDFSAVHDHVLVFAKRREIWKEIRNPLPASESQLERFTNPDNDPRGPWASLPAHAKAEKGRRQAQFFVVTTPSGRKVDPPAGRCWLYTEPRFNEMVSDNRIWFGADGGNVPRVKKFLSEVQAGLVPSSFWAYQEVGSNGQAKSELVTLFPGETPFSTPKPEALLSRVIHIASNPGDLVLDSFLGSGTTAAVAHKMGRRWIGIEMGEHPNWQEAVRDALLTRKRLAAEAVNEDDYLRPILLLQAEDKAGEVTVEKLRAHLVEQEHVAAARIAVATGTQRELDGVNLFDPACPVDVVITVEALKEGWDCSFAYVFCSLQKIGSSKDMEQLLGRVLRMPYARRRKSELLNRAYAHVASAQTMLVANALADKLVAMGFEELEAAQAVFPTTMPLFDAADGGAVSLVSPPLEWVLPESAALLAALRLPPHAAGKLSFAAPGDGSVALTLAEPPDADLRVALVAAVPDKKARQALETALDRFEFRHQALMAPSLRGVPFRPLPLLCLRFDADGQADLDLAEKETLIDLAGFSLAAQAPELPSFAPEAERKPYLLDVENGHLRIEQEQAVYGVNLDLVPTDVTETDLVRWLDARLRTAGVTQSERLVWLGKVLRWLLRERNYSLTALVRHRNQLADALAERMTSLRGAAQKAGFQLALLGDDPRGCVSGEYVFRFGPGMYPAQPPYYQGRYRFRKHYYGVIGELKEPPPKQTDHEFYCAMAIDEHPVVRHWVRNLPKSEFSFSLPTSAQNFYPDFVCELMDGRHLVVEYKGEGYKTNDDSQAKRTVGEFWAKVSDNLFLMAVERDTLGRDVRQQIGALIGDIAGSRVIAEHGRVCLSRDVESEGYRLRRGAAGTVVAIYGDGAAYAVEFADVGGEFAVVTIMADALIKEVAA